MRAPESASLVPEAQLREEFAKRRTRHYILIAILIATAFAGRYLAPGDDRIARIPNEVYVVGFVAVIVGTVAFSLYDWRCPACNKYFGKAANPRFCPKCEFQLRA